MSSLTDQQKLGLEGRKNEILESELATLRAQVEELRGELEAAKRERDKVVSKWIDRRVERSKANRLIGKECSNSEHSSPEGKA